MQHPLLMMTPHDPWTVADACEGTQIFGATGSGKTSGSGAAIARAMLLAGFGGLALTAKPDEVELWKKYAADTGRTADLIVFGVNQPHRLNFLDYERARCEQRTGGAGITENLVAIFGEVLEVADRDGGGGGVSQDPFWARALRQLLRNAIDLAVLANGTVALADIADVILSAPTHPDDLGDPAWVANSRCCLWLMRARDRRLTESERHDLDITAEYWLREFPKLDERTRASIVSTFTTLADGMRRGQLRELFGTTTTIVPECTHDGRIVIIDLPIKVYHELGRIAQIIWKYLWQRATEARSITANGRPVFLWADEAQNFITAKDMDFQATARASRACTIYLTQSLSNYLAVLGRSGEGQAVTDSFLGNLQTKIFHAQGDATTNEWAERLFAKHWSWRSNTSSSDSNDKKKPRNLSAGSSQSLESEVMARVFTTLRKGGPANKGLVDAVVFQGGRTWVATDTNNIKVTFRQTNA